MPLPLLSHPPASLSAYLSLTFFLIRRSLDALHPQFHRLLSMNASSWPRRQQHLFNGNSTLHRQQSTDLVNLEATESMELQHLWSLLDLQEDARERSACQTAAGRALWNHVIHDPLAHLLAGESCLQNLRIKMENDRINNSTDIAGVMLAVRTLWFDSKLEVALNEMQLDCMKQVVILGAGMDARAYRLQCLAACTVFEMDLPKVVELKIALIQAAENAGMSLPRLLAKHVERVAADVSSMDWFEKLKQAGYNPEEKTVWIMEGILHYLQDPHAKALLSCISEHCERGTIVLADIMNEYATHLAEQLHTRFYFHSDWPEELLPTLGYTEVQVSQIGDDDANFGLMDNPLNIFNKLRKVPRYCKSDMEGKPCRRLFLVQSRIA